jgi:hypothetical protein
MPLVRINLSKTYSPEQRQIVSDVVYTAMIEIANVPEHDKFQIFTHIPTVNWYIRRMDILASITRQKSFSFRCFGSQAGPRT